jgi:hypothetical protein
MLLALPTGYPVRSFTAQGTTVSSSGGEQVEIPTTIRAKGHDQYRVDTNGARGPRSVSLGRDDGSRKDEDGKLTDIPMHNRLSLAARRSLTGDCEPSLARSWT